MSRISDSIACSFCRHPKHRGGCTVNTMDSHGGIGWCQCVTIVDRCTRHIGADVALSESGRCPYCAHIEQYEKLMDQMSARLAAFQLAAKRAVDTLDTSMVRWNIAGQVAYREDCREARDLLTAAMEKRQ